MTTFKKYPKIHALHKEEVDCLLIGKCSISEKIDGANASIWLDKRGEITCGSRNRELSEGFNGLVEYIKNHEGINKYLAANPDKRLYGEWLVKHTITYKETSYKKFYIFDIATVKDGEEEEVYEPQLVVRTIADAYNIDTPHHFGEFKNPSLEDIKKLVGESKIGDKGEGVVIKNLEFTNKWGNLSYGKLVTEIFKEDNAIAFGGNTKHSDSYWEMYVVNKYCSLARVKKIIGKLDTILDRKLEMSDIPRLVETTYNDILTEEIWEIQKKVKSLKFGVLRKLVMKKTKQIFMDVLNDSISVADKE